MEKEIDGLEFREDTASNYSNGLGIALSIFAWIELVSGVILAFVFGLEKESPYSDDLELNAAMFLGVLIASIISFMIFKALSVLVEAANKYISQ